MAVGAQDRLDQALVKKYAGLRVDNPIVGNSMVDADRMYCTMNDYAAMQRAMVNVKNKLRDICNSAITPNIQYRQTRPLTAQAGQ